jgi:two-component system CheB/CheR fusion protein
MTAGPRRDWARHSDGPATFGELAGEVHAALRAATGRDTAGYRPTTVARAVERRMASCGEGSLLAYVARLRGDGAEAHALLKELHVGVTAFFRDGEVFAAIEERVIPALVGAARAAGELRAWVPACATGEEAYSLAMLLLDAAECDAGGVRPLVFATDIDEEALAGARRGRYGREACARVSPDRLSRFFRPDRGELVVTGGLRNACLFSAHDLTRDPPFGRLDLVSCRNVLIYFDDASRRRALRTIHQALRPGGVLVLGPVEGVLGHEGPFETVDGRLRIFRRPAPRPASAPVRPPRTAIAPANAPAAPAPPARRASEAPMPSTFEDILLREIAPACVVVDAGGTVLHYSGPVGRYLEQQGAPSSQLVDLAREHVRYEVRSALARAVKEGGGVTQECAVTRADGRDELTEIVVRPLPSAAGPERDRYLVAFRQVRVAAGTPAAAAEGPAQDQALRTELAATKLRLQATIDELEASSSEHRRANERLRSVNGELETSQEELESLNEELQTLNAELSSKVDELDRANGDLQNLFRSTDVAVVFLDRDLALKKFTPAATRLFRLIDGDVGRPITDVSARFAADDLPIDLAAVVRTSIPCERQVRVPDTGRWYLLRILPYVTVAGSTDGAVVTFADITEAKLAEAASREREARLKQIVDTVPHLVWSATADGRRDYFSQQWREYTGLSAGLQLDQGWIDAYHPDDRAAMLAAWAEAVRTGTPFQAEYRIRRHDGVYRWFKARANALRDPTGVVERWIGTSTDVDDVKRLEASLREGSRRKDEFMALLGHELRNPLAPLGNCLDILRRHGDREQVARATAVIDRQVTHLARLVDDLLDVSRITRGKIQIRREKVDLGAQLAAIVEDHRALFAAAGIRLDLPAARAPLWVEGDPARIAQMVGNLLQNARKFTERGGAVALAVEPAKDGRSVAVRVRDTGIGMDPESVERMFEAFAQADATLARSRGGLGLGLTLVRALAELHGGSVRGSSEGPGRGSEFELRLPLVAPAAASASAAPAAAASRRILVVDDNVDAADTFAELLRLEGHEVRVANDARAAIEEAREFLPEVAFCDIGLPGELDGYALARALRAEPGLDRTLLVAMTGYATEEDQRRTREAGFALHFAKPARIEAVAAAIAMWTLDGSQRQAQAPADGHAAAPW